MAALLHHALNFSHTGHIVPKRKNRQRYHSARVFSRPLVNMPIIVGTHHAHGVFLVFGVNEKATVKANKRTKTHTAQNAVSIHIVNALIYIVSSFADLTQRGWLTSVFRLGPANYGVKANINDFTPFKHPKIDTGFVANKLRSFR